MRAHGMAALKVEKTLFDGKKRFKEKSKVLDIQ
jgi:hypothetical protein